MVSSGDKRVGLINAFLCGGDFICDLSSELSEVTPGVRLGEESAMDVRTSASADATTGI